MSKLLSLIVAATFAAASVTAVAQEKKTDKPKAEKSTAPKKQLTEAQKARQKECSAQANEKKLKGDERKKFLSGCMKTKPAAMKGDKPKTEKKS